MTDTGTTASRRLARIAAIVAVLCLALGPMALVGRAAQGLTMEARVLLQGHARAGSWMAIQVRLRNDGPAVQGELRTDGGSQGTARFSLPVDVPTTSDKTYVLHAQPPVFGNKLRVDLVAGGQVVASQTAAYLVHDASQLIVGIVAERPQGLVGEIDLPSGLNGSPAVIVPLTAADLPSRVEGWASLDRLVWQDVDSNSLSTDQLAALRGWLAGGGQLVIAGGTSGIGTLSAFPDDLLPFRPTATLDVDPQAIVGLLGALPAGAADLPAMAGTLAHGRALATSGDRAIAGRLTYGSGSVTLLGFDPTTGWPAESKAVQTLWRSLLPPRSTAAGARITGDDSNLIQAVQQLPILAPPPTGGLLVLIAAYIAVVGPLNYLVLRRLDRREWAWATMPLLVIGFAAVAYGYGALLRGKDIVVNEVAVVRGAPDATEASAQVYFGLFSPTRGSYLVQVPDGALLGPTISGDNFGSSGTGALDIVQSDGDGPSSIRDLSVGFSSLRYVRAETATTAPRMHATLTLAEGHITGTFENASEETLENVAIVLGGSVDVLGDVPAHSSAKVDLRVVSNTFGSPLADQVIGPQFTTGIGDANRLIRYTMINQLTYDPNIGFSGSLDADGPVILAFTKDDVLDLQVQGQQPRRTSNAMFYVPVPLAVQGAVTFEGDLIHQSILSNNAMFFGKGGPTMFNMGAGTVTAAFRPIAFDGVLTTTGLRVGLNLGGGNVLPAGTKDIQPLPSIPVSCSDTTNSEPAGCVARRVDGLPEVELFDRSGSGTWVRLPRLSSDTGYTLTDPQRFVDPASGQVLARFINDDPNASLSFGFNVSIAGDVR